MQPDERPLKTRFMDVYGILWRLTPLPAQNAFPGEYELIVLLVGPRRSPSKCEWPFVIRKRFCYNESYGWRPVPHGASETLGLLGGIRSESQAIISESIERNIADLMTMCLADLLHMLEPTTLIARSDTKYLLIAQGPALPKAVGRFASLRPDRKSTRLNSSHV